MKNDKLPLIIGFIAVAVLSHSYEVSADVPETIPIQGRLADATGVALEGDHTLHIVLYDGSDNELFSESQVIDVVDGDFTAYIGAIQPLDVSLIEEVASVGIAVDDDMEMVPRIPFGSVPFAMHTPQLPPGMVAYFDSSTCPTGWSPLEEAQGRAIVGIPEDGTVLGSVGMPLDDLEDRPHTHNVDPGPTDTSSAPGHSHDTPAQNGLSTNSVSVGHTHGIPSLSGTTSVDPHSHRYWDSTPGNTFNAGGFPLPIAPFSPGGWNGTYAIHSGAGDLYTENNSHGHSVTTNVTNTGAASSTSHGHPFSVPAQTTTSAGGHIHSVNIPSVSSSSAQTSSAMPYVQLVVCRKD